MDICNSILWPEIFITGVVNYPTPVTEIVRLQILGDLYLASGNLHMGCLIDNIHITLVKIAEFLALNESIR